MATRFREIVVYDSVATGSPSLDPTLAVDCGGYRHATVHWYTADPGTPHTLDPSLTVVPSDQAWADKMAGGIVDVSTKTIHTVEGQADPTLPTGVQAYVYTLRDHGFARLLPSYSNLSGSTATVVVRLFD